MAASSQANLNRVWKKFMSDGNFPSNVLKSDILAAFEAIDNFIDTNTATINNAFPEPFKSNATLAQKATILALICSMRGGLI